VLFVSIPHPALIPQTKNPSIGLELRLDLFPQIELEEIRAHVKQSSYPTLLTLRKASQGGKFQGTEREREELITKLLALQPPFFDLEWDMNPIFLRETIAKHPKTKFILSYHNFEHTPFGLEQLYASMRQIPAFSYKIAAFTQSTNDALKMLLFARKNPKVSVICMGERGEFARVLGPVVGNRVGYASLNAESKTGPGQLSLSELSDIYHYHFLNEHTAIYGLVGDPVEKSRGHLHHNGVFLSRGLNAVYVKMIVEPQELAEFIPLAKELGIRGLSVTLPLKEKIVPFVGVIEPSVEKIGAINTLRFQDNRIVGTNTDGVGALDAIEKKGLVRGKKVVLLGAGGVARAIAYEAKERGASVLVLNRTPLRAEILAADLGCASGTLEEVPPNCDVLINCSPDPLPIDPELIPPGIIAMDVVYAPRETQFLQEAQAKGCQVVYGEEMFLNQAARQTTFWVG